MLKLLRLSFESNVLKILRDIHVGRLRTQIKINDLDQRGSMVRILALLLIS